MNCLVALCGPWARKFENLAVNEWSTGDIIRMCQKRHFEILID